MTFSRPLTANQNCPICGSPVTPGVMVCPTCGEDLTKASMVVSTTVRPLSRDLQRRVSSGSKALYIILATVVMVTAVIGLGYVPSVSARVPQLATLSSTVEDVVGRAVQWSREMMGQPPAPQKPRPAGVPKPVSKPVAATPAAPKPQAAVPTPAPATPPPAPVPQKPAPVPPKPVAQNPAKPAAAPQKPAPKNTVSKPAKSTPARPTAKARPAAAAAPLLQIGSRAPQIVVKDLRGVLYRLSDLRGRRVAMLLVSSLDENGRAAIRAFTARFGNHPGYHPVIIITNPDRVAVRRLAAAGIRVPVLLGDADVAAAYHVPRGGDALYVITERGAIAQARVFGKR